MRRRFNNMYLTTTISVALVLLLVGMEAVLLLSSHQLIRKVKENVAVTVLLKEDADSVAITKMDSTLARLSYASQVKYISKQQALEEHIATLGEDPEKFLGFNPLSNSYEIYLQEAYANADSLSWIEVELSAMPLVEAVNYPQEVVSVLDMHVGKISMGLMAIALVLLLVSLVLIINTVRLHVYSKRFTINTMRLVGATSWVIRSPFVWRNLLMGLEASIGALCVLVGAMWLAHERLGFWLCEMSWQNIVFIVAVVLIVGEFITFVAAMIATGRYIRMKTDRMYEI